MSDSPGPSGHASVKTTTKQSAQDRRRETSRDERFKKTLSAKEKAIDAARKIEPSGSASNATDDQDEFPPQQSNVTFNMYDDNLLYVISLIKPYNTIELQIPIEIHLADFEPFLTDMYNFYTRITVGVAAVHYARLSLADFLRVCKMLIKGRADVCAKRIALRNEAFMVRLTTSMNLPRPLAEIINGIGAFGHYQQSVLVYPTVTEVAADNNERLANTPAQTLRQFTAFCDNLAQQNVTSLAPVSAIADGTAWWSINVLNDNQVRVDGLTDNVTCEIHVTDSTPVDKYLAVLVQAGVRAYPGQLVIPLFRSERIANARQLRHDFYTVKRVN